MPWAEHTLNKFAAGIKSGGMVNTPDGSTALQRDADILEKWADQYLQQRFRTSAEGNKKILLLWMNNPMHLARLVTDRLESSFAENDTGVLVGIRLERSQKYALGAKKSKSPY